MTDKLVRIDAPAARYIAKAIPAELQAFAEKLGLSVRTMSGNFDPTTVTVKLEFRVTDSIPVVVEDTPQYKDLVIYGKMYLPGIDLQKTYKHPQIGDFKLVGWNTRAPRYPVAVKAVDGKLYRLSVEDMKQSMK